jgi:predicted dehydrogenase
MIRVGQLGVGYWGKNLLRNFSNLTDECTVTKVFDPKPDMQERIRQTNPGVPITATDEELIASPDVDAVVIAVPAVLHTELALRALAAGKHVYVEKPMAMNTSDAEKMVKAAKDAGRMLMVGHLLEYHPLYLKARDIAHGGELGEVFFMHMFRLNLGRVRTDESAMWSLAPHDISVALMMAGEVPLSVSCTGNSYIQPGIDDVAFMTLQFASGLRIHIHVCWLDPTKQRGMTVVGKQRMLVLDDMHPEEKLRVYDMGVDFAALENLGDMDVVPVRDEGYTVPEFDTVEPLRVECQAFLEAVRTGNPPPSDGLDGLRVVAVMEAADQSMKRRGEPVDLDLP